MTMMANKSPLVIPYTHNVGDNIVFDFSDAMSMTGFLPTPGSMDPRHFTGGYLYWKNDTDFVLYGTYDTSGHQCYLLPGEGHFCPLNGDDRFITWLINGKNPTQVHPLEQLHCQYLDRGDIASGHAIQAAVSLNHSIPAASIGAGALPDNVAIGTAPGPAPQATNSPLPNDERVGVELFGAGVNGDTGIYGGHSAAALISRDLGCWTKFNTYYDGTVDRFIKANTIAYQFWLDANGLQFRFDNGTNRVAGGQITWGGVVVALNTTQAAFSTQVVAGQGSPVNTNTFIASATNGQGAIVAVIQNVATSGANADLLDLARLTNQPQTFRFGITNTNTFYIYDLTNGIFTLQIKANHGPFTVDGQIQDAGGTQYGRMKSLGGGAAGFVIWEGTTDPTTNAVEGDLWVDA